MCPPLLKTCPWVIAQFNSLWRQRLTSVAFPCVLTQDAYRRLRDLRRVFLRFETVFSFQSIRGFISFGKWRIFVTVRCKNWCQEISAYNKLVNKLFKVVFLAMLAGVQNMRKIMLTVITVQAQVAQRADNSHPTDKSLSSYSKNWCFKLWKFRQNTYKNSRIWCPRILKHRGLILLFASLEK